MSEYPLLNDYYALFSSKRHVGNPTTDPEQLTVLQSYDSKSNPLEPCKNSSQPITSALVRSPDLPMKDFDPVLADKGIGRVHIVENVCRIDLETEKGPLSIQIKDDTRHYVKMCIMDIEDFTDILDTLKEKGIWCSRYVSRIRGNSRVDQVLLMNIYNVEQKDEEYMLEHTILADMEMTNLIMQWASGECTQIVFNTAHSLNLDVRVDRLVSVFMILQDSQDSLIKKGY
ncbi:hypothetical protein BKA93DRAFT_752301 [Sparassis latifolia]